MINKNTQRPRSILMILNDIAWFWSHRIPLAKAIIQQGDVLSLATASAENNDDLKMMGVLGYDLPDHGMQKGIFFHCRLIFEIIRLVLKTKPDLVHVITLRHALYTGFATKIIGYGPVVFTVAGVGSLFTDSSLKMRVLRLVLLPFFQFSFGGKNRFVIFQNPDDLQLMLKHHVIKEKNTIIIRGSGVDLKEFDYTPEEKIEKEQKPIVLFSSRLIREKGIDDFIEAAKILKTKGVQARFQVAGDIYEKNPHSLTRLEMQRYHDLGIIEWLGQVTDMPVLLKKISLMVLPSYYGEGVPKILLEAAAIGRAIITCDVPGCREAVQHQKNGILVAPRSPDQLATAIEELLLNATLRHSYGKVGRAMVEQDFHVESVVARTLKVYDDQMRK